MLPIVAINLQTTLLAEEGSGTKEDPWSLSPIDLIGKYINYGDFIDGDANTYYNADATGESTDPNYKDEENGIYGIYHYSIGDDAYFNDLNTEVPHRETDLKWRIFRIQGNGMTLVSDKATSYGLRLYGYQGYNNIVKLLNDLCKTCYSSTSLESTARSLNIGDIEEVCGYNPAEKISSYGTMEEISQSRLRYIPNICKEEVGMEVNGTKGTKLRLSEQDQWYSGYSEPDNVTSLSIAETYYQRYASALGLPSNLNWFLNSYPSRRIWLASRCAIRDFGNVPACYGSTWDAAYTGKAVLFTVNSSGTSRCYEDLRNQDASPTRSHYRLKWYRFNTSKFRRNSFRRICFSSYYDN